MFHFRHCWIEYKPNKPVIYRGSVYDLFRICAKCKKVQARHEPSKGDPRWKNIPVQMFINLLEGKEESG